jgi:hypothetical protein
MESRQREVMFFTPEQESRLKSLFAAALMRQPDNPFAAARELVTDPGQVSYIATQWPTDPVTEAMKSELLARRGPLASVPTKEEFAARVFQDIPALKDTDARLKYMRFFAEIMGYIDNGKNNVNVNLGGVGGKTLAVPLAASDEEWEAKAMAHSKKLLSRHG